MTAKLSADELVTINVDVLAAASKVRSSLPKLKKLKSKFVELLNDFEPANLDDLEVYLLALVQAHSLYLAARAPVDGTAELIEEASRLRNLLLSDIGVLVNHGHLRAPKLASHGGRNGIRNIASDLLTVASLLRRNWRKISSRCAVSTEDIDRAEMLGERMVELLGMREHAPVLVAEAALERQQVFTLFAQAYDQVRRAVTYVRWDRGDAEKLAPSIYAGRNRRKAKRGAENSRTTGKAPEAPIAGSANAPESTATSAAEAASTVGTTNNDPFVH